MAFLRVASCHNDASLPYTSCSRDGAVLSANKAKKRNDLRMF